ncbi:MAG: hypothetical protein HN521_01005 [Candidatus Latescibacteria bacterium]|jgi:uncharacterized protein|nr:hypothetical protein [Candidatus Latescibacterota bacterium]
MHQMPNFLDPDEDAQNVIPMLKQLYKTESHIFKHQAHHILFNVASGDFFEIDAVQKDMVEACSGCTLNDILNVLQDRHTEKQVLSAFKSLLEAGIITDTPLENMQNFSLPNRLEIVHFDLEITTDTLSGVVEKVAYMDEEVALKALALLLKESGRVRQCSVAFRGGEPLLNAPLVEKVIEEGYRLGEKLGKEMHFQVVTDVRLLNKSLFNRLQKLGVEVIVKFDVDERPPLFGGQGAYSLSSVDMPEHIQEKQAPVGLHYALDGQHTNFTKDMQQILDLYPTVKRVDFAPDEPVVTRDNLLHIQDAYANLAQYVAIQALHGQETWIEGLEKYVYQVFNQKASFLHSGIGVHSLTVDPDGVLQASPTGDQAVGTVWEGVDRQKQGDWIQATRVDKLDGCKTCWARHLCGGACRLQTRGGDVDVLSECELTQYKYELAMRTCLNIASQNQDVLYQRYME